MAAPNNTPPTVDQEAELWTAADVARYLKLSRSWVYRESSAGRLPSIRILGVLRFDPAAIRALREVQRPGAVVIPLTSRPS
jgi:predicted DNA-binding transcriptional regulator AlpA